MSVDSKKEYREPGTGRYAYWNGFDRLCKCGHTLGIHVAGGYECAGKDCRCQKFKPTSKRAEIGTLEATSYGAFEKVVR